MKTTHSARFTQPGDTVSVNRTYSGAAYLHVRGTFTGSIRVDGIRDGLVYPLDLENVLTGIVTPTATTTGNFVITNGNAFDGFIVTAVSLSGGPVYVNLLETNVGLGGGGGGGGGGSVTITSPIPLPVTATTWPLPTGAATELTLNGFRQDQAPSSSITNGVLILNTSSAFQLPTVPCKAVHVKSIATNLFPIFVGTSTVIPANGFPIYPTDSHVFRVNNADLIWAITPTPTQLLGYFIEQ